MMSPTSEADSFSKGLAGIIAGRTAISSLQGDLRYRGYSIEPLALAGSFEETAYLLLYGELPDRTQLAAFSERVGSAARSLEPSIIKVLSLLATDAPDASPMDALRTAVSVAGQIGRDEAPGSREQLLARAEMLIGQVPAILAAWIDLSVGRSVPPWPDGSVAAALLTRLTGRTPSEAQIRMFDTTLVLYAEHEFNASTFAARTVVSTGSDMHSGVVAAIGALKGPLHGGANEQVLAQLAEIGSVDQADAWVTEQFSARRVVMGFGHRVYKDGDVRAKLLGRLCHDMAAGNAATEALNALAARVESLMLDHKSLRPNLDWPAARVYHALGLPIQVFTPIFVVARMSGWTAHIIEQVGDNRLIRPLSLYDGPAARSYVAIEDR